MLIVESESDSKSYGDNKSMRISDVNNYVSQLQLINKGG